MKKLFVLIALFCTIMPATANYEYYQSTTRTTPTSSYTETTKIYTTNSNNSQYSSRAYKNDVQHNIRNINKTSTKRYSRR